MNMFFYCLLFSKGVSQDAQGIRPVTALRIIAVPLMDIVAVMIQRFFRGHS